MLYRIYASYKIPGTKTAIMIAGTANRVVCRECLIDILKQKYITPISITALKEEEYEENSECEDCFGDR